MKYTSSLRNAFTMIELIFVIIILGIVASIGSEIIAQVYESYIVERAQYRASIKTELALNEIANRLRYAIPGTVGYKVNKGSSFGAITDNVIPTTANVLQWVGYDGDSFEAINSVTPASGTTRRPGWSGFCDINAYVPGSTSLPTPGSNLGLASTIISNLGGNLAGARIYFPDGSDYNISSAIGETITLSNSIPTGSDIYERYKLAWSSYALVCENPTNRYRCGDLYLYYNFTPTVGVALGNNKSLLLKGVDNFRFKGSEGSIRIKICKSENIDSNATNDSASSCKEKVVF